MLSRTLFVFSICYFVNLSIIKITAGLPVITADDLRTHVLRKEDGFYCTLIQGKVDTESDNQLEISISTYLSNSAQTKFFLGAVKEVDEKTTSLVHVSKDESLPILRCFLGPALYHDYRGSFHTKHIGKWLKNMRKKNKEQWQADVAAIMSSQKAHVVTIVLMPSLEQAKSMDGIVAQVTNKLSHMCSVNVITVHPKSTHRSLIFDTFKLPRTGSVAVFLKFDKYTNTESKIFKGVDIDEQKILTFISSRLVRVKHLSTSNFASEALTIKKTERFRPHIILFYAWWADGIQTVLKLFKDAVQDFQSYSIMTKFALVDLSEEKHLISRYIKVTDIKTIPFVAVFEQEQGMDLVNQFILDVDRPSTYYLYQELQQRGVELVDPWGKSWNFAPYQHLDYTQFCDLQEGPRGSLCTAWASNLTDSESPMPVMATSAIQKPRKKISKVSMRKLEGIPMMTESLWDTLMEKSDTRDTFIYHNNPGVRVTMIAFIRDGCGSCSQKMLVFKQVFVELQKIETKRFYLVNCSSEVRLCESLKVKGYPSIVAFRHFGSLAFPQCNVPVSEQPYIRRDFHGPISTGELIQWQEGISKVSIQHLQFTNLASFDDMEDVRLVATAIPKSSRYLPLAPRRDRNYFYRTGCLRLACEQLFGLASCYMLYSKEIPQNEFTDVHSNDMVITQIMFERRDGVSTKLMSLGKSLQSLLEEETTSQLHMFHRPHQYSLDGSQKCEDNHDFCTQLLVSFTRDHLRLPVTQLSSEIFHTNNNPLFEDDKPLLIGFVHPENINMADKFVQLLYRVAIHLYKDITVATIDVTRFPAWVGRFVPHNYYNHFTGLQDAGPLHEYPRLCLVNWRDHHQAAFFPPLQLVLKDYSQALNSTFGDLDAMREFKTFGFLDEINDLQVDALWEEDIVEDYVRKYLNSPNQMIVKTEHF